MTDPSNTATSRPARVLLVGEDRGLVEELRQALRGAQLGDALVETSPSLGRAAEEARANEPDLIFFQLGADLAALRRVTDELHTASPRSALIGIYAQGGLGDAETEGEFLIQALRSRVRDFLRRPISSAELAEIFDRHGPDVGQRAASLRPKDGLVICFVSGKGGVGKSTLAANTAAMLQTEEKRSVLLIDTGLQLGVVASLFDLRPEHTLVDATREIDRLDETLLRELSTPHESGVRVLAAPRSPLEATEVDDESLARVLAVARRCFDVVVVDTAPVLDSILLSILDRSDRVVVVLGTGVPSVLGTKPYLDVLQEVGVRPDDQILVANQNQPSHSASLRPEDLAARIGRRLDLMIQFEKSVLVAENTGEPAALKNRRSSFGRSVRSLVDLLVGEESRR